MNAYKPGQSVRVSLSLTLAGVLVDSATLAVTVTFPDGTSVTPTLVHDSQGTYHADFLVPFTMVQGIGYHRSRATGVAPSANALAEHRFRVDPLGV